MGMWFSNIHIRKNDTYNLEDLKQLLIERMTMKGYRLGTDEEGGEALSVIYAPSNSDWISIASDEFQFNTAEDVKETLEPFSAAFGTDTLAIACYDSGYLFMNYLNVSDKTDAWVNVGKPYGAKTFRRTSVASVKNKVSDYEGFKSTIKKDFVFAEEVLTEAAGFIGMDEGQALLEADTADEQAEGTVIKLNFFMPEGAVKELPIFKITRFNLCPCSFDQNNCVFVNNKGGKSRGVGILFYGDWVENNDIILENVTLEIGHGSKWKVVPVTLERVKHKDGTYGLYWQDESFVIPPAVNTGLPIIRYMNLEFDREFGVRFTLKGSPRKVLDVKVAIIPLENPNGQDCWFVYRMWGSKEEFIRYNNEEGWQPRLNPEDYDL